jgi:hypothetical protein
LARCPHPEDSDEGLKLFSQQIFLVLCENVAARLGGFFVVQLAAAVLAPLKMTSE